MKEKVCSTCGLCLSNLDIANESMERKCSITKEKKSIDDTCGHHKPKGISINRELLCESTCDAGRD